MRVKEKDKGYKQKYNEEHYKQLNMRISSELNEKFTKKKDVYGSAPKVIEAGLNALDENLRLRLQIENLIAKIKSVENNEEKAMLEYMIEYREPLVLGFILGGLLTVIIIYFLSVGRFWN